VNRSRRERSVKIRDGTARGTGRSPGAHPGRTSLRPDPAPGATSAALQADTARLVGGASRQGDVQHAALAAIPRWASPPLFTRPSRGVDRRITIDRPYSNAATSKRFRPVIAHIQKYLVGLVATLLLCANASAYEQAYPKAPVDDVEISELPVSRWIATEAEGDYFDRSGTLFRRLFDYIGTNDIAMTVPVEGRLDSAEMRFYLGAEAAASAEGSGPVRVIDTASRRVARLGAKGSYSRENVDAVRSRLEAWVDANPEWRAAGPVYAVFWNGPFTPWFMKRFEVHIVVESNAG
jgi:hypothetical protein